MMPDLEPTKISRRNLLEYWWIAPVLGAGGFFTWFGIRSYRILLGKNPPGTPSFQPGNKFKIARVTELQKPGDAKAFDYPIKIGSSVQSMPAILIRVSKPQAGGLSQGSRHFIALSRICTHQDCTCEFIVKPEIASMAYKYRPPAGNPILGCACHFSAFDPEKAGMSVSGPALKPLPRLQLELRNNDVFAVGLEKT
jgi:arsenite oxidase small subunit